MSETFPTFTQKPELPEGLFDVRKNMEREGATENTYKDAYTPQNLIASQISALQILEMNPYKEYLMRTGRYDEFSQDMQSIDGIYQMLLQKHNKDGTSMTEDEVGLIIPLMEGLQEYFK